MGFNRDVIGKEFGPFKFAYQWKDTALYALGCGAGPDELGILLETKGPKVLPTFSVVVVRDALIAALGSLGGNFLTLVHGGEKCVLHKPLPNNANLETRCKVTGLYDKGKGALAVYETKTVDEKGELLFETEWQIFYRGEGGFGGERGPEPPPFEVAAGATPTAIREERSAPTQALLYRLNGDLNPIHSDPEVATAVGFPKPILHGLCTFGYAGRAAVNALCGGDPERVTQIEGRFSKPVFPGDTIETALYTQKPGEAFFVTKVKERNEAVITLGRVLYRA